MIKIKKEFVGCRIIPAEKKKLDMMALNQGVTISEVLRKIIEQA